MRRLVPPTKKKLSQEEIKRRLTRLAALVVARGEEPQTFRCKECCDIGYIIRTDSKDIVWARPCIDCLKGQQIIEGDHRRREKAEEKRKRKDRVRAERGEDLPI